MPPSGSDHAGLKAKPLTTKKAPGLGLLTRQKLAEALGLHPQTITTWEADGMPVARKGGRGVASKYSLPDVFKWRVDTLRTVSETTRTLEEERTRLTKLNADRRQLDLLRERREVLPRAQIVFEGQVMVRGWSSEVRALPRKLVNAGLIAPERESEAKKMMFDLLTAISRWRMAADVEHAAAAARAEEQEQPHHGL